jgi:hypothetical protein
MAIGWMDDLAEADTYFNDERLESIGWDNLSHDKAKTKALIAAYNRLYYGNEFTLPTYAAASAAELVILKKANCEMAYYLSIHMADEDRRKGLNVQGVIEAGIVKEKYHKDWLERIPIPPIVWGMLWAYKKKQSFFAVDITRDETEDI